MCGQGKFPDESLTEALYILYLWGLSAWWQVWCVKHQSEGRDAAQVRSSVWFNRPYSSLSAGLNPWWRRCVFVLSHSALTHRDVTQSMLPSPTLSAQQQHLTFRSTNCPGSCLESWTPAGREDVCPHQLWMSVSCAGSASSHPLSGSADPSVQSLQVILDLGELFLYVLRQSSSWLRAMTILLGQIMSTWVLMFDFQTDPWKRPCSFLRFVMDRDGQPFLIINS